MAFLGTTPKKYRIPNPSNRNPLIVFQENLSDIQRKCSIASTLQSLPKSLRNPAHQNHRTEPRNPGPRVWVTLLQRSTTDFLALCRNRASGRAAVAICPVICQAQGGEIPKASGPRRFPRALGDTPRRASITGENADQLVNVHAEINGEYRQKTTSGFVSHNGERRDPTTGSISCCFLLPMFAHIETANFTGSFGVNMEWSYNFHTNTHWYANRPFYFFFPKRTLTETLVVSSIHPKKWMSIGIIPCRMEKNHFGKLARPGFTAISRKKKCFQTTELCSPIYLTNQRQAFSRWSSFASRGMYLYVHIRARACVCVCGGGGISLQFLLPLLSLGLVFHYLSDSHEWKRSKKCNNDMQQVEREAL